jgi:hypothetical protein
MGSFGASPNIMGRGLTIPWYIICFENRKDRIGWMKREDTQHPSSVGPGYFENFKEPAVFMKEPVRN